MKLLVVSPYFYPSFGGVQSYAFNISKELKEKYSWEIVIITSNHKKKEFKVEVIEGMRIYRLPYLFKIYDTPINPLWFNSIKKIINIEKPDIINSHTPVPFISDVALRVSGKTKNVLTYHNDLFKSSKIMNFLCKMYYLILENKTLKLSDRIVVTTELYAKKSIYLSKYKDKLAFIPPGVDIEKFKPLKIKKIDINKNILFVGVLDKEHNYKGLEYLIEATAIVKIKIPNLTLNIVGRGNNIDFYKKCVRENSLSENVVFHESVSEKKLPEYYQTADILVLPSYNNSEGFGIVLIEAGACAIPVIGTTVGGIPHVIIDNNTGILVPPKDVIKLSQAMHKILSNRKFAKELGINGYKRVLNEFTWERSGEKTHKLFIDLYNNEKK